MQGSGLPITALGLINTWTNRPFGANDAGVTIDVSGVVSFRVRSPRAVAIPNPSCCLPRTALRPTSMSRSIFRREQRTTEIEPSGDVFVQAEGGTSSNGSASPRSMEPLSSRAPWDHSVTLENRWTNAPFSTDQSGVTVDTAGVVRFQGGDHHQRLQCGAIHLASCLPTDDGECSFRSTCAVRRTDTCRSPRTEPSPLKQRAGPIQTAVLHLAGWGLVRAGLLWDHSVDSRESLDRRALSREQCGRDERLGSNEFQGAIATAGSTSEPLLLPRRTVRQQTSMSPSISSVGPTDIWRSSRPAMYW